MTSPVRRVAASGPRARSFRDPAAVQARRRWSLVPALALLLAAGTGAPRSDDRTDPAAADRPPNVVFIMADDPGIGELGAYGQEHIRRPAMDRPAAEGMRVTHHDGGSPVCTPSRAVRLTARARPHAVVRDNREVGGWSPDEPEGRMPLPPGTDTSARRPQDAGYATATIGTRGLGGPDSTGMPNRRGFDLFHGYRCRRVAHDLDPTHLRRSDVREDLPGHEWGSLVTATCAQDLTAEEAVAFLERNADRPFLLHLPFHVPHPAPQVPREEIDASADLPEEGSYDGSRGSLPHPSPRRACAGMVTRMDRDIGRIVDRVGALGLGPHAIVIVTSDDGPTFDVGGPDSVFVDSTAGRRGRKGSRYEGGIRVPLLVRRPGRVPAGTTSDVVSAFEDRMPRVCGIAGVPGPEVTEGGDLPPVLLDRRPAAERPFVAWEFPRYGGQEAVRMGRWKAVRRFMARGEMEIDLFDLETDPGETTVVAADHRAIAVEARRIMREERKPSPAFPMPGLDRPVARPPTANGGER